MKKASEGIENQERWNEYGRNRLKAIEENPDKFTIYMNNFPLRRRDDQQKCCDFMKILGPLRGKRIIELGCGCGDLSVFLAKCGAEVTGVDIGPDLVAAATLLGRINEVGCEFKQVDITRLPFPSNSYDVAVGVAILHHLPESKVLEAVRETHRILNDGGVAVFSEPVENSKIFEFIQNIFPVGEKGSGFHRPSVLQRKEWAEYVARVDERAMTSREFLFAGSQFRTVKIRPYGFLNRLESLLGKRYRNVLRRVDMVLFKMFPPLRYLCRSVLVEYRK